MISHCAQCGAKLVERRREGRRRRVCPQCGHVAYRQPKIGAGTLIEREGALLLARRGPGMSAFPGTWNLPSGYCEADEAPQAAAVRETREETGLAVEICCLVDAYYFDDDPRGDGLLLVYEAEIVGGELHSDGHEATALGFFPADDLPEVLCGGGHDQAIRAWQRRALDRWQPGEPLRYCPHCAHPLEERLAFGRQRPVCRICGFVHFRELKVGISVLVKQEGRLLLVRRAIDPGLGLWSLPSGFVEWDEDPEAAAVRECREETGLEVVLTDGPEVSRYTDDFRGPGINLTYPARVVGGRLRPADDAADARFFAPEELPAPEEVAFQGHATVLEQWRRDV